MHGVGLHADPQGVMWLCSFLPWGLQCLQVTFACGSGNPLWLYLLKVLNIITCINDVLTAYNMPSIIFLLEVLYQAKSFKINEVSIVILML